MTEPLAPIVTHVGHAEHGENRYFGFAVGADLAGTETLAGLISLAVGGARLAPQERALLDDIGVVMTVADPRIWPLKMTRVVASYGGALAAVAAANACIEQAQVGHWTSGAAAELLTGLLADAGEPTVEAMLQPLQSRFAARTRLVGFGVPFRAEDERVLMLRRCVIARGREGLVHWRAFEAASGAARRLRGLEPNIGLAVGAACLDLNFSPRQISLLCVVLGQTDYVANAVEGAAQKPSLLQRLPTSAVLYTGPAPRISERSLVASRAR
jgi:hypothetical protein